MNGYVYKKYLLYMERELKLRNYSPKTIKTYMWGIGEFLKEHPEAVIRCDEEKIKDFLLNRKDGGLAAATINSYLNSIKYFYKNIIKVPADIKISFARRPKRLPSVLTHKEVVRILGTFENIKHKWVVALAYGAGLRVSEVVNLKVKDLFFDQDLVIVRNGKGAKDRLTLLPEKLRDALKRYVGQKDPNCFVFESNRGGKLHTRTVQKIFGRALKKAGIVKDATFHSLRHSFATHLIENGTDIRYVQELLGHRSLKTTQIYTQVTKSAIKQIKSPL